MKQKILISAFLIALVFCLDNTAFSSNQKIFPLDVNLASNHSTITTAYDDVDSDGYLDVISSFTSNQIGIVLNNGDETFDLIEVLDVPSTPHRLKTVDLNNDNHNDIVYFDLVSDSVTVLLHDGIESFLAPQRYFFGPFEAYVPNRGITFGDLNNDTFIDVVLTHQLNDSLTILFNNGDGSLDSPVYYYSSEFTSDIKAVDVDNDSDLDLIFTEMLDDYLGVMLNDGNGAFAVPYTIDIGNSPLNLVTSDINQDGKTDLLTYNQFPQELSLYFGDGMGGFVFQTSLSFSEYDVKFVLGDIDHDSHIDIVVEKPSSDYLSIFYNDGTEQFTEVETLVRKNENGIQVADFNNDSQLDIQQRSSVYFNLGGGNFVQEITKKFELPLNKQVRYMKNFDYDLDGDNDLVFGHNYTGEGRYIQLYTNDGSGNFTPEQQLPTNSIPTTFALVDFNQDGYTDIAYVDYTDLVVYFNSAGGIFSSGEIIPTDGALAKNIYFEDIDNDADLDMITASSNFASAGYINVHIYDDSAFHEISTPSGFGNPFLFFKDFNNDSFIDFAYSYDGGTPSDTIGPTLSVMLNNGDSTFTQNEILSTADLSILTVDDFNNDGNYDIYFSNQEIYLNDGNAVFVPVDVNNLQNFQQLSSVPNIDLNNDSNADYITGSGNSIQVQLGAGDGTFMRNNYYRFEDFSFDYFTINDFDGDFDPDIVVAGAGINSTAYKAFAMIDNLSVYTSCCLGIRGNVDNDPSNLIDIADLVYLVAYSFSGGPAPFCAEESDVDGSSTTDIGDIVHLVDYMFTSGPAPVVCP